MPCSFFAVVRFNRLPSKLGEKTFAEICSSTFAPARLLFASPDAPDGEREMACSHERNLSPRIAKLREHFVFSLSRLLSIDKHRKTQSRHLLQNQKKQPLLSAADVAEAPVAALAAAPPRSVVQLYRSSTSSIASAAKAQALAEKARKEVNPSISSVKVETCFNVGLGEAAPLGRERAATLAWLLAETFEPEALTPQSSFGSSWR